MAVTQARPHMVLVLQLQFQLLERGSSWKQWYDRVRQCCIRGGCLRFYGCSLWQQTIELDAYMPSATEGNKNGKSRTSVPKATFTQSCDLRATFERPEIDQDAQWSPKPITICFCVTATARLMCVPWATGCFHSLCVSGCVWRCNCKWFNNKKTTRSIFITL